VQQLKVNYKFTARSYDRLHSLEVNLRIRSQSFGKIQFLSSPSSFQLQPSFNSTTCHPRLPNRPSVFDNLITPSSHLLIYDSTMSDYLPQSVVTLEEPSQTEDETHTMQVSTKVNKLTFDDLPLEIWHTPSSSVASVSAKAGSPRGTGDPILTSLFLLLFDLNYPHTNN
jgi:hypothetical protein